MLTRVLSRAPSLPRFPVAAQLRPTFSTRRAFTACVSAACDGGANKEVVSRFAAATPSTAPVSGSSWASELDGLDLQDLQSSRPALWKPDPLTNFEKRYYWLLKAMRVYSLRAETGKYSEALFRTLEEQANQNTFYNALSLPRDFQTEHALMVLHLWILHCRMKVDYLGKGIHCGRRMQEQVFERFWEDCVLKIRNVGVPEMRVNKQLETLQKVAFRDLQAYDAAITVQGEDDHVDLMVALWNGVFKADPDVPTETVLQLVDYTRREVMNVMQLPADDFYHGWIPWGPAVGETPQDRLDRQKALFEGEWREAIHVDGRMYFYHTTTREKQWEVPKEGLYPRRRYALLKHLEREGVPDPLLAGSAPTELPAEERSA